MQATSQVRCDAKAIDLLPADQREMYEERAGIIEFEAGKSRIEAECLAWDDLPVIREWCGI